MFIIYSVSGITNILFWISCWILYKLLLSQIISRTVFQNILIMSNIHKWCLHVEKIFYKWLSFLCHTMVSFFHSWNCLRLSLRTAEWSHAFPSLNQFKMMMRLLNADVQSTSCWISQSSTWDHVMPLISNSRNDFFYSTSHFWLYLPAAYSFIYLFPFSFFGGGETSQKNPQRVSTPSNDTNFSLQINQKIQRRSFFVNLSERSELASWVEYENFYILVNEVVGKIEVYM